MIDKLKLSKIISYSLRHNPKEYEMVLDNDGWGNIDTLLMSITKKHNEFSELKKENLITILDSFEKKRHEVKGNLIRALHGHSKVIVKKEKTTEPPVVLFHGTTEKKSKIILKTGLNKMERQYVHLSADKESAIEVASRKTNKPIVLYVKSKEAFDSGIPFFVESNVWLSENIPSEFIYEHSSKPNTSER